MSPPPEPSLRELAVEYFLRTDLTRTRLCMDLLAGVLPVVALLTGVFAAFVKWGPLWRGALTTYGLGAMVVAVGLGLASHRLAERRDAGDWRGADRWLLIAMGVNALGIVLLLSIPILKPHLDQAIAGRSWVRLDQVLPPLFVFGLFAALPAYIFEQCWLMRRELHRNAQRIT